MSKFISNLQQNEDTNKQQKLKQEEATQNLQDLVQRMHREFDTHQTIAEKRVVDMLHDPSRTGEQANRRTGNQAISKEVNFGIATELQSDNSLAGTTQLRIMVQAVASEILHLKQQNKDQGSRTAN